MVVIVCHDTNSMLTRRSWDRLFHDKAQGGAGIGSFMIKLIMNHMFAFAGRYSRLMADRAKERLKLSDGPVVCLRRSSHRLTALGMIWHYTKIVLAAGAERAGMVH